MSAAPAEWSVRVGGAATSAVRDAAAADAPLFVCAHGAGGHMRDRSMTAAAAAMRAAGLDVVRFNFLYREQGGGRPDPMPRLQECIAAVVDHALSELGPRRLIIGGRSMGGRAASMLAAAGFRADGLLLLAYPLHPAGRPDKLRDAHLADIAIPVLCLSGTRDALCRKDLMETALRRVGPRWTMHWLDCADHSFHVLKSSGRTDTEVLAEVTDATSGWVRTL